MDYDYDRTDALEDEALARLRDADAMSDTETEDELTSPPTSPWPRPQQSTDNGGGTRCD